MPKNWLKTIEQLGKEHVIKPQSARDRLIVALDVSAPEALLLVESLRDVVALFKVGSQLFTTAGPDIVRAITRSGARVFLDLKFHDIPHQVSGAARAATELGVAMFTLHASGGLEMMQRAVEAAAESAEKANVPRPAVLAVSVLTSMDEATLAQIGMDPNPAESVLRLVKLAEQAGVDGVVASPREIQVIRANISKPDFLLVTPGIRPSTMEKRTGTIDDQKRIATAREALTAGADYLVVGRPITAAEDPVLAARELVAEID